MSTKTPNFNLNKPEITDVADITGFNQNWDTIDEELRASKEHRDTILPVEKGGTGVSTLSDLTAGKAWHLAPNTCSNKDFNTLKTAGYYFGYTGMTNAKITNEISVLEVIPYSSDWVLQRQTRLADGRTFFRYLRNGDTWGTWGEVCTSKQNIVAPLVYVSCNWVSTGSSLDNYLIINADGTTDTSHLPYAELPLSPSAILKIDNSFGMWSGSLTKGNYAGGWYLSGNKVYLYKTSRKYKSSGDYTDSTPEYTFGNSTYAIAFL